MEKMLFGAFVSRADADAAIADLEEYGLDSGDISVIAREEDFKAERRETPPAASDAAAGAGSGAVTGGVIGGIAGLLAGAGVIPALAGLLIGGPVAALLGLTGVAAATVSGAVTGAVAGGLIGALTKLGFSESEAKYYDETVRKGGLVLGVPVDEDEITDVKAIMEDHNATHIQTIDVSAEDVEEMEDEEEDVTS